MRTIKFKAKGMKDGEWIVGDLVHALNDICINPEHGFKKQQRYLIAVDPDTICQFTGFTDGLDREIYEGDVLRSDLPPFSYIEGKVCEMDYHYAVITWQEECGAFVLKAHKNRDSSLLGSHNGEGSFLSQKTLKKFFIMGNINEHEWQERLNIINRRGL